LAASSLTIVPVPVSLPARIVAASAVPSLTISVSSDSTAVSLVTTTEIVLVNSPGAKVSVPLVAV